MGHHNIGWHGQSKRTSKKANIPSSCSCWKSQECDDTSVVWFNHTKRQIIDLCLCDIHKGD